MGTLHSFPSDPRSITSLCERTRMTDIASWSFTPTHSPRIDSATLQAFGPLRPLATDDSVTDVFVVGDGRVFADRGDGAVLVTDIRVPHSETIQLARSLIETGGRHLDEASPVVDVRLVDGVRVHAALPPIALGGALLSIRFARLALRGVDELQLAWDTDVRRRVLDAVDRRETLLVSGATGSGKTTLLGALLSFSSPRDRLVVIEDVSELRIDHPHVVQLECRQANIEGSGEISLDRLVRESLRMRPTRLIVGECRGSELRDLLSALTTGHRGGAATIHANSLAEVPTRLDSLAALAGLTTAQLARQAHTAFDLLIHVDHTPGFPRELSLGRFVLEPGGGLGVEKVETG